MRDNRDFTSGPILSPLIRFMIPVFFAMLLQAMYGAVDLIIVGQFAHSSDVSAVSTGSQMMMTITNLVTSFAMGTTILLGQRIGEGRGREGGAVIGGSISLFAVIAAAFTLLIPLLRNQFSTVMHAPKEAFSQTAAYICICGIGSVFIIAYNLVGSIPVAFLMSKEVPVSMFHIGLAGRSVPDLLPDCRTKVQGPAPDMRSVSYENLLDCLPSPVSRGFC